jgi:hypothetical protein
MGNKITGNLTAVLLLLLVTSGSFAFMIREKGVSSIRRYPLVNDDADPDWDVYYNYHDPAKSTVIMNADMKEGGGTAGEPADAADKPATFFYHEPDREASFWKIAGRTHVDTLIALIGFDRK